MSARKQRTPRKVIACTCRTENYGWIGERRLYNLPLPKGGMGEGCASVTHVAVYALDLPVIARAAKYVRDVDVAWLAANGYRVSPKPHGEKYALFELGAEVKEATLYADAEVYVCSTCWTGRIDAGFFEKPLPQCGGKSVPNIFERIRPFFMKWRAALAYNYTQMDFMKMLDDSNLDNVPFPAPKKGKFTFIDLFAGIGGIRLGFQTLGGRCVFSSEWDAAAAKTYYCNFGEQPYGDIQKIDPISIPDFDILLAGFPCQPFSKWRIAS